MTHTSTPTKPRIEISICPTGLEVGEDVMDAEAYLDAIRTAVLATWPDARIATLQVGYRQGDEWFRLNGRDSDAVRAVVDCIDCSDEKLYPPVPYDVGYRRGHAGIASREDWSDTVEARTALEALQEAASSHGLDVADWEVDTGDGLTLLRAPDESGNWEHNLMARHAVDHEQAPAGSGRQETDDDAH